MDQIRHDYEVVYVLRKGLSCLNRTLCIYVYGESIRMYIYVYTDTHTCGCVKLGIKTLLELFCS